MFSFSRRHLVLLSTLIIVVIGVGVYIQKRNTKPAWTTDVVTEGAVRNLVSVSGVIDAVSTAQLAFPVSGIIESIGVKEGDTVAKDQVLATLGHNDLNANYQDAKASVAIAEADRDELVSGISTEARDVSKTTAEIAKEDLTRITKEQNDRVENAYRTLLSSDLAVQPEKKDSGDTPPTLSGTYTCDNGAYVLSIFNSGSRSGYSYRSSGLEEGTYSAFIESPAPLGTCGLSIQFSPNVNYGNSTWTITIPNVESSSYVTNQNTYNLAVTQRTNAIHEAEQKLTLAEQNNTLNTATPRTEALVRADARVLQAQAKLESISAQIHDHILTAPFPGTVTNIDPVPGETVTSAPIVTMVSSDSFALTALIPEIDVTKIHTGQKADIIFDARENEKLSATITFISPLAKEIDGVSYFEAKLTLDTMVDWLKSGLNADVDIIVETHDNVVRLPKRYLVNTAGVYTVLVPENNKAKSVPISVQFMGNDGFVEISGLSVGATIIAP